MAYNLVTLLIYHLNFFFKGVFNFVIQEYFLNLKKHTFFDFFHKIFSLGHLKYTNFNIYGKNMYL